MTWLVLFATTTTAFVVMTPPTTPRTTRRASFEPVVDSTILVQQLTVVGVSSAAFAYWWLVTVPEKRLEVSRSKKSGEIKEYLDDIDTPFEKWLFADWLDPKKRKDPAIPFLPKAKFNSGDNPILVATALIMATGVLSEILLKIGAAAN